ncbi:MAG: YeeE/YedE family protein [Methyloligellaceae bacterium]
MILSGLSLGLIMGATARGARFCTFGAVEDFVLAGKTLRIRSWALAIAIAMICVQMMRHAGVARIDQVFYLQPEFGLAGAIAGGFLFGLGMSMVGTCGYGVLVRMAGGDLKAFFNFLVLGITGYMTARGLTSVLKVNLIDRFTIDLSAIGGQGVPHLLAGLTGAAVDDLWLPSGLVIGGALCLFCFRDAAFRHSRRDIIAGLLIGLAVAGGFFVTGVFGADPFDPVRVQSLTYVLPLGETLIWLMTFTGSSLSFAIAVVIGTVLGAYLTALKKQEFRWESFDDVQGMLRHIGGAAAMGAGGVTALGCTIGQGVSGVSTLAMSPPIALASIFAGSVFGLYWLMTGSVREALLMVFGREAK